MKLCTLKHEQVEKEKIYEKSQNATITMFNILSCVSPDSFLYIPTRKLND